MAMTNFLYFPPNFKWAMISNMNLNSLVVNIEDSFRDGVHSWTGEMYTTE